MHPFDLYELKETLNKDEILICFAGPLSQSVIEELGKAVKSYLEASQLTKASLMDVFSIFIEQTQNMRNYAEQKTADGNRHFDFNSGIVLIGKCGDRYVVSSGNFAERKDIERAVATLEMLKGLDKQGLKAAFKEQIRKERPPGRGQGLGLIEMSRKASAPIEYAIRNLEEPYCFFSLKATV